MYKNPIPHIDDQDVAKHFYIVTFEFETPQTIKEATDGINQLIEDAGGKIPDEWVKFAERPDVRHVLPQDELREIDVKVY